MMDFDNLTERILQDSVNNSQRLSINRILICLSAKDEQKPAQFPSQS